MLDNFKEFGNSFFFIASLIQFAQKWKEKSHSFKIFSGISPPAALFEGKSFTVHVFFKKHKFKNHEAQNAEILRNI